MLTLIYAHKSYTLENGEAINAMKGAIEAREVGDFAKGEELFSQAVKLENAGCTPGGVPLPAPVVEVVGFACAA